MPNEQLEADKKVVFGMVDGSGIWGRPHKEWLDDIKEWWQMGVHSASILAQSRTEWRQFVKRMVDTNGHWAHGSMVGWMDGYLNCLLEALFYPITTSDQVNTVIKATQDIFAFIYKCIHKDVHWMCATHAQAQSHIHLSKLYRPDWWTI